MTDRHAPRNGDRLTYQNRILTIIAVLLAIVVSQRFDVLPDPSSAVASQASRAVPAPPNAASQRLKMIQELEKIDRRMESIEKKLAGPFDVNVVAMPEIKVAE